MTQYVNGTYFKGGESTAINAVLEKNERGFRVLADDQVLNFCAETEINVSNHLGDTPRKLNFPDGSMMVISDNALIDTWFQHRRKSRFFSRLSSAERSWTPAIVAVIIIPLIFYTFFKFVIPAFARPIAHKIPQHYSDELDQYALSELNEYLSESKLGNLNIARVTAAFDLVQSNLPDLPMSLYLRDGGEFIGANAFALPGGSVIMTDQVLEAKLSIPEMTAIFAHEAGHVYHKHGLQQLVKVSSVGITLTLLLNDLSFFTQGILVSGGTFLQTLSYSRAAEREADDFSRDVLTDLDISPACFGSAIEKLGLYVETQFEQQAITDKATEAPHTHDEENLVHHDHEGDEETSTILSTLIDWLSTHPSDEERMSASEGTCISG